MVLMDGDISQRSLRFASSFGKMLYVRNNNNETNKEMHVTNDPANWEDEMYKDIDEFKNMDPNFRICIISQSSKQCMSLNDNIMKKDPELKIKMLTGTHSGITKTVYFEDIKNTLEHVMSLYSVRSLNRALILQYQCRNIWSDECSEQLAKSLLTDDREV